MTSYIELREKLRPYVRERMKEAHEKGTPVMRPLFYDFPEDPKAWETEDAYMFGPNILVSPVTEAGQEEKQVYLPEGPEWRYYWSGETFTGGKSVTVRTPLDQIPLFITGKSPL